MPKKTSPKVSKKKTKKVIKKSSNLLIYVLLLIFVLLLGGLFFYSQNKQARNNQQVKEVVYSLTDVEQHAAAEDCWMAIEGRVYDVTAYIAEQVHPGGKSMVKACGKEATEMWNNIGKEVKKPHSSAAKDLLNNYYIGNLN